MYPSAVQQGSCGFLFQKCIFICRERAGSLYLEPTAMADTGLKKEHIVLAEVPYDDDEVALVGAAMQPALDDADDDVDPAKKTGPAPDSGGKSEAQMNGVMVLSLLDKIIGVVDQIQQTQNGLEARQEAMEKSVSAIQGELGKLSKNHVGTANTVNKMLDKVRKVSVNVKTVRSNLEKQAGQIKRLESNENELLKRRNFKVLIYQVRTESCRVCVCVSITGRSFAPQCGCCALHVAVKLTLTVQVQGQEGLSPSPYRSGKLAGVGVRKAPGDPSNREQESHRGSS